ncbi:MAG: hypothetical protein GF355_17090 [Candidatus Eisenbacteria bacterium]|nr:hypothetical protein [Candidatus Eisenbacteria bacterium]
MGTHFRLDFFGAGEWREVRKRFVLGSHLLQDSNPPRFGNRYHTSTVRPSCTRTLQSSGSSFPVSAAVSCSIGCSHPCAMISLAALAWRETVGRRSREVIMQRGTRTGAIWRLLPILLLASSWLAPQARADEPMLALRLAGGESAIYAVGEIIRIGFEGEETLVVVTGSGSDVYGTEAIERIEFLFEVSSVEDPRDAAGLITAIHLFQNRPNPIKSGTRIGFELPRAGQVELSIYSLDGRLVRTLVAEERAAGRHSVAWDGRNESGRKVSGGAYFYRLRAPGCEESRRMILLP